MSANDELVLVDGSGYIFRAYYALPPMHRSDGLPVNAAFGFCNMLLKLIEDIQIEKGGRVSIAVIFDAARETFRNSIYSQYKANRSDPPEDLIPQFNIIKKIPDFFNLKSIQSQGFEADDLIASYSKAASEIGKTVTIISSDKDLMQLLKDNVSIIDPIKKREVTKETVLEKFGVIPEKVIDVQALAGDSSDNIPGAPGIGPKIASLLINQYDSIENLLDKTHEIKQDKRRASLEENKEIIKISKQLVTLKDDVELPISIDELSYKAMDVKKLISFLEDMEFNKIKSSVISKFGLKENDSKNDDEELKKKSFLTLDRDPIDKKKYELV